MAEPALAALFRAVNLRLINQGGWSTRVHNQRAPAGVVRPYVVYQWQGGGERNRLLGRQDAEIVLLVKAVSTSLSQVLQLSGQLSERLNDAGQYDDINDCLAGGTDWYILTTTQEGIVHIDELIDGETVYHNGFLLRVVMERK